MTPAEYRAQLARAMTEAELLAAVLGTPRRPGLADSLGWLGYHTHRSQHSPAGFPDLVLAQRGRLVFAELKRERRGKRDDPTQPQREWLDAIGDVGDAIISDLVDVTGDPRADMHVPERVSVHLWRPSDLLEGRIEAALRVSE